MLATYLDLLNSDGTRNMVAFASILDRRVTAEINLRLTYTLYRPDGMAPGDEHAWRAQIVKEHGLGPVSADERKRIADHELSELEAWAKAMKRGADTQRFAMLAAEKRSEIDAYAIAAE